MRTGGGRGAEMHIAELADFTQENLASGKLVYLSSLDVEGAFDFVPHRVLLSELKKMGVQGQ